MTSLSLLSLTSISQMGLFLGIASILFGWVEKKEKIVLAGHLVFLSLGFLTLWVLITDQIIVPDMHGIITKQVKVLAFFKALAWFSLFNGVSLLLKFFQPRLHKYSLYILVLFAMMLFFMVYSIQQMPG